MEVEKYFIRLINQLFALQKKARDLADSSAVLAHTRRMQDTINEAGYSWQDPLGEAYSETRTDCEASIAGTETENLHIVEVIKPIVYHRAGGAATLVQKGIVIVERK